MRSSHTKTRCRSRHQLHQTTRAFRRNGARVEMRLLLHHEKDQVRINSILVTVLSNQAVEPGSTSAPTTRFLSRLRNGRGIFNFDPIDTSSIEKDRHRTTFVPNTGWRLARAVGLDARSAF